MTRTAYQPGPETGHYHDTLGVEETLFTWVQSTNPIYDTPPAVPADGQTWLDTARVTDGYFTLWIWFAGAGGWTNQPFPEGLGNQFAPGTILSINNSGALTVTGLPTANPNVAGQIWNNNGNLKVSAG